MQIGSKELVLKKFNFHLDGDDYFYFSSVDESIIEDCDEQIVTSNDKLATIIFGIHKFEVLKVGKVRLTILLQSENLVNTFSWIIF